LQIECAIKREKSAFDHINTDWNLPNEDGSTDFSDDETVIDERVSYASGLIKIYADPCSVCLQKSRSRPPSFAGGDSPILRSRSSTCDSIQSSSSPIANCPSRQFTLPSGLPSYTHSAGTSPKQHISVGQYLGSASNVGGGGAGNGGSSPSSASSQSVRAARNSLNMQSDLGGHVAGARKSTSTANMNSLKKRTAPAPPPGTLGSASSSSFYGTLPHPPRHSQNFDANDIRAINHKNQSLDVAYGTLPHLRSVESSPRGGGGYGYGVSQDQGSSSSPSSSSSTS